MALSYKYSATKGEFAKAMGEIYRPIARATSAAIAEASADIKTQGRASIAKAGFSKRWQNAFRVIEYPSGGKVSADAAALAFHRIPYAEIFESGGTIRGKPLLWLPLPGRPKKLAGQRLTPKVFKAQIGPLTYVARRGVKPPLLMAPAVLSRSQASRRRAKVSAAALRRGARGSAGSRSIVRGVPIFVGLPRVDMPKKFALLKIIDRAAGRLAELYVKHMKAD